MITRYDARDDKDDFSGVRDAVVRLRVLGHGIEYIGKTLGISDKKVRRLLEDEFKQRFADRDELKRQTSFQLDWLARPLMLKFEQSADRRDAEAILKILQLKTRIFGLEEAVKIEVRDVEQLTDAELNEQLARHRSVLQLEPPPEPRPLPPAAEDAEWEPAAAPETAGQQTGLTPD